MAARYEHVHIDVPELRSDALVVDLPPEETLRVAALLTHSDVFVNVFSTMTLEACLVDKPTVVVNWTAGAEISFFTSPTRTPRASWRRARSGWARCSPSSSTRSTRARW